MKNLYLTLFILTGLLLQTDATAKKRKVLFIGNSYIHVNDVPNMLKDLCTSFNDTLIYNQSTPGGYTLASHSSDFATAARINSDDWDVVIIQEQSQRPAFSQTQVANDVYPYATSLYNDVKANNICSEVMFMMTWGYKNGDASNCGFHPPICTYAGMQEGLRTSYMQMMMDNVANVSPVGAAWKVVRDSFPAIELYSPDESHPSVSGSYLETCVLYASIFHKNPMGSSFTAGVNAADAANLQRIAAKVVLDSMEYWQGMAAYPYAKFTHNNGPSYTFQNESERGYDYLWDFGDGTTSILKTPPAKTYTANGKYVVTLTVSHACSSDEYIDTIQVGPVNVHDINGAKGSLLQYTNHQGNACFKWSGGKEMNQLLIFNMQGRKVAEYNVQPNNEIVVDIAPGVYVYKLVGENNADNQISGKFARQ